MRMDSSVGTKAHNHKKITVRIVRQREGVPYEVERTICAICCQVFGERPVRRAAA